MEIRSLPPIAQGPQGLDALGATAAPPASPEPAESKALDPPVKVDISASGREARYVRDQDTSTMVFQVVDPTSGDVIAQLPSETALRNRAYASGARTAQGSAPAGLSRVA